MIIDLRSDTVTKPSPAMIEAMFQASVGDDVFGDDPSINLLQQTTALYFGMEEGLFFPSGTMANQVAIKTHTLPGEEIICDQTAHVYRYEGGGIAFHSGCSVRLLNGKRGVFAAQDVEANVNADDIHFPKSSLLVLENTVNKGGGICWTDEQLSSVSTVARTNGLRVHLDGARVWNAILTKQQNPANYGKWFDSVSVCFSKGLGCPVGSVLVGSKSFISNARKHRKRFGGGMRQAGYLAAACLFALENNIERLKEDHIKAKALELALSQSKKIVEIMPVETNIVLFKLESVMEAASILHKLKDEDILAASPGEGWIRFVTHLDVSNQKVDVVMDKLKEILN